MCENGVGFNFLPRMSTKRDFLGFSRGVAYFYVYERRLLLKSKKRCRGVKPAHSRHSFCGVHCKGVRYQRKARGQRLVPLNPKQEDMSAEKALERAGHPSE